MAGEMAFLYGTPTGVQGAVSRPLDSEVESIYLGATPPLAYGMVLVPEAGTGKYNTIAGTNVAGDIKGFLTRSVPNISSGLDNTFSANTPNASEVNGRLTRGYIHAKCTVGTPVKGGIVYVRIVATTGTAVGDIEATADATAANQLVIPSCEWAANGKDANNIAEIRYTI